MAVVGTIGRATRTQAPFEGYQFEYETFGDPSQPALLLVMGLGAQMIYWPLGLVEQFVEAGFFVVRFDNRDCGKSTVTFGEPPKPSDFVKFRFTGNIESQYLLTDMADDAFAVLDHLEIERAHVAGASMGGMIVQTMAMTRPERVLTLTSIMSTTGHTKVGQASLSFGMKMLPLVKPVPKEQSVDVNVKVGRMLAGDHFDEAESRERAALAVKRGFHPKGRAFQTAAIMASGDRTQGLQNLKVPSLVIHGRKDRLIPISGGAATASAIPGCRYVVFDDMGHDLPRHRWPQVVAEVADLAAVAVRTTT